MSEGMSAAGPQRPAVGTHQENLERLIRPFVHPRATSRRPVGSGSSDPGTDVLTLEVRMVDWWRLCAAAGDMDGDYLRMLGEVSPGLVPSEGLLAELDAIYEARMAA